MKTKSYGEIIGEITVQITVTKPTGVTIERTVLVPVKSGPLYPVGDFNATGVRAAVEDAAKVLVKVIEGKK